MNTYNFRLTDDLTIPVRANSQEEALRILKSEMVKKEASPLFDSVYFDYETGINIPRIRQALARQEKRSEKEAVLRSYVNSSGFTTTTKGDYAITPEGQKVLIEKGLLDEDKLSTKNIVIDENKFGTAGDFADFAGAVGPIAGALLALSPQGKLLKGAQYLLRSPAISRMVASGIGSTAGKGAEEGVDFLQGFQDKDANELADLLQTEFVIGGTAQGLGELGGKIFGAFFGRKAPTETIRDFFITARGLSMDDVLKLDRKLGREATEKEMMQAVKRGEIEQFAAKGIPTQRQLGREIAGRMQAAGETVFGKAKREQGIIAYNLAALNQLKRKIADKRAKLDEYSEFAEADSKAVAEIRAKRAELDIEEEKVTNELNKLITDLAEETGGFSNAAMQGTRELGENVQEVISKAYNDIQNAHRASYAKIEARINSIDPENTINLSDVARHLGEELQRGRGLIKELGDKNTVRILTGLEKTLLQKPNVTLAELIEFRKILRGAMNGEELGSVTSEMTKKAYQLIDEKINNLPNDLLNLKGPDKNKVLKIVEDLKKENALYYKNHIPFDRAKVRKIVSAKNVDGDDIYNLVFGVNEVSDMRAIINAIPVAQRAALTQSLLRRYMKEAAADAISDPITGQINPARFANKILKDKQKLQPLLGNRSTNFFQAIDDFTKLKPNLKADELIRVADELSGRIGQLEATTGAPASFLRFIEALKNKAKASADVENLKKDRIFARIETASPEEVAKIVFRPKSSEDILRVKNAVTEDAFADIQEQALEQILRDSVQTGSTKLNDIFKPGNLERALTMYGDDTLEAMFGKEMTQSLKAFSRTLRATAGETGAGAAGTLVAGTLALNVFNVALWPMVAALGFYKQLFSNPRIVSLLAKQDKNSIATVLNYFSQSILRGGFRETYLQTLQAGEKATEGLKALEESEEGQGIRSLLQENASQLINLGRQAVQPTLTASLDLPEVSPVPQAGRQQQVSQSLLGSSPANIDIAQSLGRLA
jgi:hypothetical protein